MNPVGPQRHLAGRPGGRPAQRGFERHRAAFDPRLVADLDVPARQAGVAAHGSPVVLRQIVEMAIAGGARLAEPGEFTMRAFLNGRMDLTQAEAVRDLIESQTLYQAKVAVQQLEGALANRLRPIKQQLVELIAQLEAGVDFAEDDVGIMPDALIVAGIAAVKEPLQQLEASFAYGKIVHEGVTLAIVGRPNVGKSSLFNKLVEREHAIVTDIPGTTRDLVTETVAIGGIPVKLIDTAGLRESSDVVESIGIEKTRAALADADVVLFVTDEDIAVNAASAVSGVNKADQHLLEPVGGQRRIIVRNKSDLSREWVENEGVIRTSAITGAGLGELRQAILSLIHGETGATAEPGFLTNARQHGLIREALQNLANAQQAVQTRVPHEMLLLDLYGALKSLDAVTGVTTADDILHLIFSSFCIGK